MGEHGEGAAARPSGEHDIKLTDPERHKKWNGAENHRLCETTSRKVYETFPNTKLIVRTPLIPGVNDDEEHIRATLALIRPHKNVIEDQLLPYHRSERASTSSWGRCTS